MQQQPLPPSPPPPVPPDLPPVPGFDRFEGRRLTNAEIESLRRVRAELSTQLTNVLDRRGELSQRLERAGGVEREGLEGQIRVMNGRIARLEGDLEHTSQLLTNGMFQLAPGTLVAPQSPFDRLPPENVTAIAIVFTIFVLAPIAVAIARLFWRRATGAKPAAPSWDSTQRMERMEHAVDSIAVEVERISEGQRFVTKLLTESPNFGALHSGSRVGEGHPQRDAVKVPRDER